MGNNKEFQWTDELVQEYVAKIILNKDGLGTAYDAITKFKKSKEQPIKEERIQIIYLLNIQTMTDGQVYEIKFNRILGKGDGEKVKQAIESVLNNDAEDNCVFNVAVIKKIIDELKDCKWVKSKTGGSLRYVTRKVSNTLFEDDGLISGKPSSPMCHFDNYEDCTKEEEVNAWCGYIVRQQAYKLDNGMGTETTFQNKSL